jgi:hypothetical protein
MEGLTKLPHIKHHRAKRPPITGDGKRRGCFLILLSAAVILLFIVLPFWLLYKRTVAPPATDSFGPPPASAIPASEPVPARKAPGADDEDGNSVKF